MKNKNTDEAPQNNKKAKKKSVDTSSLKRKRDDSYQINEKSKSKDKSPKFPVSNNILSKKVRNESHEKRLSIKTINENNTTNSTLASKTLNKDIINKNDDNGPDRGGHSCSFQSKTYKLEEKKESNEKISDENQEYYCLTYVNNENRKDQEISNTSIYEDINIENNPDKENKNEWVSLIDNGTEEINKNYCLTNIEEVKENHLKTDETNKIDNNKETFDKLNLNKIDEFSEIKKGRSKTPIKDLLERMEKFSQMKAEKIEQKRKKIAEEIVSQVIGVPQINEKSKKLVMKDFATRQEDYKTNSNLIKNKLFKENEEKIRRELTPNPTFRKKVYQDTFQTFENHINFQFQWDEERKQRIEQKREKEFLDISRECTFTPKISKKSDMIAKAVNKDKVIERLYNQDRLKKRNRYLIQINDC